MAKSRGTGVAQRGYDYNIYKKGGKVKKYEGGGGVDFSDSGSTRTFSDLFGRKKTPDPKASGMDDINTKTKREEAPTPIEDTELRSASKPRAKETLPTRPTQQQQRRMAARRRPTSLLPSDTDMSANLPVARAYRRDSGRQERAYTMDPSSPEYRPESAYEPYRKGGKVKMASGGSCRGMGAATRGGKYKIK